MKVSFDWDDDFHKAVKLEAVRQGITMSEFVIRALKKQVKL